MMALRDVTDLIEQWYPPRIAESWDRVGLVCGDPAQPVRRVLLAVDPSPAVAQEAAEWGADLVVVHHPLFLHGVHGVAATTPKGRTLHTLLTHGCALYTAHTNADLPSGGVNEALAAALGVQEPALLAPAPGDPLDHLAVYAPMAHAEGLRAALAAAGAGAIGEYDRCSFTSTGEGRFRPVGDARPSIGEVGREETVAETRVEVVLPRSPRAGVLAAMRAAHPYEEVAHQVVEMADDPQGSGRGSGRLGDLADPTTLRNFAERVAAVLPATARGVAVAGDPDRVVRRVATVSGAGDFALDLVRATDADVLVTSDVRHHPASEFVDHDGPALVDVAHWAAEWTWLPVLEARMRDSVGDGVELRVSTVRTDPWTFQVPQHPQHPVRPQQTQQPQHRRGSRVKSDPSAQLTLLDLQGLDARSDVLRHRRAPFRRPLSWRRCRPAQAGRATRPATPACSSRTSPASSPAPTPTSSRCAPAATATSADGLGAGRQPKDLERMQHEMVSLQRRITELEDVELEVMERLEAATGMRDDLEAQLAR